MRLLGEKIATVLRTAVPQAGLHAVRLLSLAGEDLWCVGRFGLRAVQWHLEGELGSLPVSGG